MNPATRKPSSGCRCRPRFCVPIWLLLLTVPTVTAANIGPPSYGGHVAADPVGLAGISISRETLFIDLRPLAVNSPARVEAVYHLHNNGAEKTLELLFASGSEKISDFRAWLGEKPLFGAPAKGVELPTSWQPPQQTPGLKGERGLDYLSYGSKKVTPVGFTVTVPPDSHDLKVRYAAETSIHHIDGHPTIYHQFAYVLAPARAWPEFGGLDVTIRLPENWRAACAPALARKDDTLAGSFADLPADAIALTVQAPEGWAYRPFTYAGLLLFGLAGIGGAAMCWMRGRSRGRHPDQPDRAWLTAIGLGAAWGLAILGTGLCAVFGPDLVLPAGQASHHGYGQTFAMLGVFFLSVLAIPLGFAITQSTSAVIRRKRRKAAS